MNPSFWLKLPIRRTCAGPLIWWSAGPSAQATLAGDATRPMCPRRAKGDAPGRWMAARRHANPRDALMEWEARRPAVADNMVLTNREHPLDFFNIKIEELKVRPAVRGTRSVYHVG